jgi:hypothetical protein
VLLRWFFPMPFAFRAAQWSDGTFSLIGFSVGIATASLERAWTKHSSLGGQLEHNPNGQWRFVLSGCGLSLLCVLSVFWKPVFGAIDLTSWHPKWKDGVCIQTTASTCGPCSATTILKKLGVHTTEKEMARRAYTHFSGTRHWYLVRALRQMGLSVTYQLPTSIENVRPPAIIGVWLRDGSGHWITLLKREQNEQYVIGDSLQGRLNITRREFDKKYQWNQLAITIRRK